MTTLAQLREAMTAGPWRIVPDSDELIVFGPEQGQIVGDGDSPATAAVIALVPELVAVAEAAERIDASWEAEGRIYTTQRKQLGAALAALRARLENQ